MVLSCLKSRFSLKNKFEPCFASQNQIILTSDDKLLCSRFVSDSVEISILNGNSLNKEDRIEDVDGITCFAVCPTDSTVILATKNLLLKRIDPISRKLTKVWKSCHQRPIYCMSVNHNSTRLATGSGDFVVRIWHIGLKEGFTASCRGHSSMITHVVFHPTQSQLYSIAVGDLNILVWNTETGARLASLDAHQSTITSLDFSPDQKILASSGRDKVIILWSCIDFNRLTVIPTFESLESCVFLPPGALRNHLRDTVPADTPLILSGGQWGCLRVWDPQNSRCVLEIKGPLDRTPVLNARLDSQESKVDRQAIEYGLHSIVALKLSYVRTNDPDGDECNQVPKLILVRQSNHVEFYDPMIAKLSSEFLGDIGQVDQLCIAGRMHNHLILADASPHLKIFLNPYGLGSNSSEDLDVRSWKCHLVPGGHTDVITDLTVSVCGQWLASGSKDQSICLWRVDEPDENTKLSKPKTPPAKVILIACLDNAHAAHISAVHFDHLTTRLVSASEDHVLKVWSLQLADLDQSKTALTECTSVHGAHHGTINSIDVSVNNQFVATASRDKTVKIWKFEKRQLLCVGILQGHKRGVWSVCFSTREKLVLTASADGDIKLWNLKDFSCIRTFEGHEQPVYKAVFLSECKQILSCDQRGLVRLWDVANPSAGMNKKPNAESSDIEVSSSRIMEAHEGRIWSLVVTPDESGFYTGGEDATLCYFEDISEQINTENTKQMEEFVQTQQLLNNLVHEKQFPQALKLAIKLDQPKRTLDILQEILLLDEDGKQNLTDLPSYCPHNVSILATALDQFLGLSSDNDNLLTHTNLAQRLLGYAVNWNTRARTSPIAQSVLHWILTRWTPQELLKWPNIARTVESLLPYTARHYQRISRLEEQLAILDYISDLSNENHLLSNQNSDVDIPMTDSLLDKSQNPVLNPMEM